jgi:cell division protein FtsW
MGSAALAGASGFQIGDAVFRVEPGGADGKAVAFQYAGSGWRYDGATLYRDGSAQPACPDATAAAHLAALWNRAAPQAVTVARPLVFGGNLHCGNRLGLEGIPPGAATPARNGDQLLLSGGAQDDGRTALRISRAGVQASLRQEEQPLAGILAFSIGRTRFQLAPPAAGSPGAGTAGSGASPRFASADNNVLTFAPSRHVALFTVPDARLAPQVSWHWQQRALWNLGQAPLVVALLAAAIAALAASFAITRRAATRSAARPSPAPIRIAPGAACVTAAAAGAAPAAVYFAPAAAGFAPAAAYFAPAAARAAPAVRAAAAAALFAAGVAAVVAQRAGHPASAACSLLLGAAALALWLCTPKRLPVPMAAALVLLAPGLLAQLELGLGASVSSWLRYYQKSTALLAAGSGAAVLWQLCQQWQLRSARARTAISQRTTEWLLAGLAACSLAALAAQVLWGDETGVFDLQPVELAKLALTALTAHCLALRMGWNDPGYRQPGHAIRWLQLAAPALLFLALLGFALVQVDDFSPLILLLVWSMAMAFAYAMAARKRAMAAALACIALTAVAAIALVRDAGADGVAQWPLAGSFYADRFQVWLAPAAHPHTGQQLLLGARAIADGGWWGADSTLGLRSLGLSAGSAVNIPAVQDDFAPAFFLNRHGLLGAVLLWTAQAALVAGLLHVAARAGAAAARSRDFRQAWCGRFRCFALCGGAALLFGHLLLSWGTNLAIFPIMGQPMSFLSAGGSHLLFFLCPLLACCAVSAQSLEENEHADLRPT